MEDPAAPDSKRTAWPRRPGNEVEVPRRRTGANRSRPLAEPRRWWNGIPPLARGDEASGGPGKANNQRMPLGYTTPHKGGPKTVRRRTAQRQPGGKSYSRMADHGTAMFPAGRVVLLLCFKLQNTADRPGAGGQPGVSPCVALLDMLGRGKRRTW